MVFYSLTEFHRPPPSAAVEGKHMKRILALSATVALAAGLSLIAVAPAQAATGDVIVPTSGKVTGIVGAHCEDKSSHAGIDIAASSGSSIVAGAAGTVRTVINSSEKTGYGTYVVIDHGAGYQTLYGHMINGSPLVSVGEAVTKGERIARWGPLASPPATTCTSR